MNEQANEVHHYHHSETNGPRLNVKVVKNTKGWNYEITVTGAATPAEALAMIDDTEAQLIARYGEASE